VALVAYGDESMRQRRDRPGIYVVAATVFESNRADEFAARVVKLGRGRRAFHWRDEEERDRRRAIEAVGDLDALHLAVVGIGLDGGRQERHRRQCLLRLIWELEEARVPHLWLDDRRPHQNADDLAAVAAWRASRVLPTPGLKVDFVDAAVNPLVVLPDIVAGAVGSAQADGDGGRLKPLAPSLEVITIELT
jgi:hypothetical protein